MFERSFERVISLDRQGGFFCMENQPEATKISPNLVDTTLMVQKSQGQPPEMYKTRWGKTNIFYFHPYLGKIPILTITFQRGLKPPTRKSWGYIKTTNPSTGDRRIFFAINNRIVTFLPQLSCLISVVVFPA